MIEEALARYPAIDLRSSIIVGDSVCDVELAQRLGLPSFGINVECGYVSHTKISCISNLPDVIHN